MGGRPIHPSEVLKLEYGVTWERFKDMGVGGHQAADILNEGAPITEWVAEKLATALGTTPAFWLNLQTAYELNADAVANEPSTDEVLS